MENRDIKMLLSYVNERGTQCSENYMITFSRFLDINEKSMVTALKPPPGVLRIFYGGFPDAERKIAVFLPDYISASDEKELSEYFNQNEIDNPLTLLVIKKDKFSKALSHRDYLGALMSLGIKREMTGDIAVDDSGCRIAVMKSIAPFIAENLTKAGHGTLAAEIKPISEFGSFERVNGTESSFTVSGLRLDSIIKNAFSISRNSAGEFIEKGLVFVNDVLCQKPDRRITAGDKIVLRHRGRIIIRDCSGVSKKGRIIVVAEKFL